jgi:hypothetical protein
MDDAVLGWAFGFLRDVDIEVTLVFNRRPMDWIDVLELGTFVIEYKAFIGKGSLHLGEEVSVNNGDFGCVIGCLWYEIETNRDLIHFVVVVNGNGTGQRSGHGNVVRRIGFLVTVGGASGEAFEVEHHHGGELVERLQAFHVESFSKINLY